VVPFSLSLLPSFHLSFPYMVLIVFNQEGAIHLTDAAAAAAAIDRVDIYSNINDLYFLYELFCQAAGCGGKEGSV
jgi:hypothetical protein